MELPLHWNQHEDVNVIAIRAFKNAFLHSVYGFL